MSRAELSAIIRVRHGYLVTVELTATPAPGEPLDSAGVVYQMHAAGHRIAAELWAQAELRRARWAVDVSYARVALELTADESAHDAALAAQAACRAAGITGPAAVARPPAKAKGGAKAAVSRRARAR
jgi:hypothetical protein